MKGWKKKLASRYGGKCGVYFSLDCTWNNVIILPICICASPSCSPSSGSETMFYVYKTIRDWIVQNKWQKCQIEKCHCKYKSAKLIFNILNWNFYYGGLKWKKYWSEQEKVKPWPDSARKSSLIWSVLFVWTFSGLTLPLAIVAICY